MVLVSWACVLQCCWYRDDPIMRYHVFVVKFDYTLVDWSFLYCELLHYVLICYLCTTSDSLGILPRDICSFQRYLYRMYYVHFWVVIVFTSWNMCHVNIVCFLFFPVASVLPSSGGSICGSPSSVIAATLFSTFCDVCFCTTAQHTRLAVAVIVSYVTSHLLHQRFNRYLLFLRDNVLVEFVTTLFNSFIHHWVHFRWCSYCRHFPCAIFFLRSVDIVYCLCVARTFRGSGFFVGFFTVCGCEVFSLLCRLLIICKHMLSLLLQLGVWIPWPKKRLRWRFLVSGCNLRFHFLRSGWIPFFL